MPTTHSSSPRSFKAFQLLRPTVDLGGRPHCYFHLFIPIHYITMSSFIAQIMQPGGGIILLPFVRLVIAILLVLTVSAAVVGLARIHMIILAVLSAGLLVSLSFFESEFKKMQNGGRSAPSPADRYDQASQKGGAAAKTD
jgi:hypothetical protein